MIEINLLPHEYKKTVKKDKIPLTLILLSVNGIFLAALFIFIGFNLNKTITLNALTANLKGLAKEQEKIIAIGKKIENFKKDNLLFEQLFIRNFLWSNKLNELSDLIIPGIWLRCLFLQEELIPNSKGAAFPATHLKFLKIDATAVSVNSDEMALISKFIGNLKSNKEFFKDFTNIKLESSLRRKMVLVEVMDFTLVFYFKAEVDV